MTEDPIIDRSSAQKLWRVEKMREELRQMGYSVVTTEWLASALRYQPPALWGEAAE
jgi:hypothetical protein